MTNQSHQVCNGQTPHSSLRETHQLLVGDGDRGELLQLLLELRERCSRVQTIDIQRLASKGYTQLHGHRTGSSSAIPCAAVLYCVRRIQPPSGLLHRRASVLRPSVCAPASTRYRDYPTCTTAARKCSGQLFTVKGAAIVACTPVEDTAKRHPTPTS